MKIALKKAVELETGFVAEHFDLISIAADVAQQEVALYFRAYKDKAAMDAGKEAVFTQKVILPFSWFEAQESVQALIPVLLAQVQVVEEDLAGAEIVVEVPNA